MFPKGEKIKRAITWVNENKDDFPGKNIIMIANEASVKFDLNPPESEFLVRFFKEQPKE